MSDGYWLTPEGQRVFRELDQLGEMIVNIGFQHGKASEKKTGADICDVAAFNEFGTENMPSRPFLRDSVYDNEDMITNFLQAQVVEIIRNGKTAEQVLNEIGVFQKSLVQDTIEEGHFEPNALSTIRRKGSDHPLIDTGTMKNSVNYVIKKKG